MAVRTDSVAVKDLRLDLKNYRTVAQPDEVRALHAMVTISPEYFWALTESMIDSGYLPTENILVLEDGATPPEMVVKEGNRRVAALKLIHGYLPSAGLSMPSNVATRVAAVDAAWKAANAIVPCAIYPSTDAALVDRIVTLAHGKGERAGRDNWNAVARARHNKARGGSEPGLELLEKYLVHGMNLKPEQQERWSGKYPVTVADEAIKKLYPHVGVASGPEMVRLYPSVPTNRVPLESALWQIGQELIGFPQLRKGLPKLLTDVGFLPSSGTSAPGTPSTPGTPPGTPSTPPSAPPSGGAPATPPGTVPPPPGSGGAAPPPATVPTKSVARATNDPRSVISALKKFKPRGLNREKLVTLLEEARGMELERTPIAFCFLLRSMFEISAKAYCDDNASAGLSATKANGDNRKLADVLTDITAYMTASKTNPGKVDPARAKLLQGALTDLSNPNGFLSVTSMNQLVHSQYFTITAPNVSALFHNVFPLLQEMNR
jgi:hypothetical protein